jgi:hypothetical protein
LRDIRVIAGRIGAIVPSLRGVRLAVVIIAIVWGVIPPVGVCERSTEEKPVIAKSIVVEPAIVKALTVEPAPVKSTEPTAVERPHLVKPTAVKAAKSTAAVKTPAATAAMRPGIGEIWLTERRGAQQANCDCKSPPCPGPGSMFA